MVGKERPWPLTHNIYIYIYTPDLNQRYTLPSSSSFLLREGNGIWTEEWDEERNRAFILGCCTSELGRPMPGSIIKAFHL